jgi:hypothetical protein
MAVKFSSPASAGGEAAERTNDHEVAEGEAVVEPRHIR